jgi:hypothetical protein
MTSHSMKKSDREIGSKSSKIWENKGFGKKKSRMIYEADKREREEEIREELSNLQTPRSNKQVY